MVSWCGANQGTGVETRERESNEGVLHRDVSSASKGEREKKGGSTGKRRSQSPMEGILPASRAIRAFEYSKFAPTSIRCRGQDGFSKSPGTSTARYSRLPCQAFTLAAAAPEACDSWGHRIYHVTVLHVNLHILPAAGLSPPPTVEMRLSLRLDRRHHWPTGLSPCVGV
ncbi:uncharacterized protein LY89DRAFT_355461 [Mollisia scopiformis]|uniref:Uncharacterized protein n=1 Tax=Mollisia scopiformis TaxID=149040 RepID=A0A132B527_MOLSC|nr:uncharacterized protein LY89DRAFT_355461 [Mollisia scopiformis]KUJ07516.1 hypothetical protein LY89DRAFT_355461 [Mollisia scopiformis]